MNAQVLKLPRGLQEVRVVTPENSEGEMARRLQERERLAYERGRLDGEKALSEQLMRQRTDIVQLQQGVLESLRRTVPQVVRDSEQALTSLALEVAQKLVAGMPVSVEMIEATVREALSQVEDTTDYHIYVHPEDMALLEQFNSGLLANEADARRTHFHCLPELARGGCLVKTRFGVIDAQRATKLALLEKSLLA